MKALFFVITALLAQGNAYANLCTSWSSPKEIGTVDGRILAETSGMVVSRTNAGTMYMHNDSFGRSAFYQAQVDGSSLSEIGVSGGSGTDVEDIAYGPCPGKSGSNCIFLADIGDNFGWRGSLNVMIVEESARMPRQVRARNVSLSYPGNSHDAEAFAVHPNGDFYIVTKDRSGDTAFAPHVYRFKASDVASGRAQGEDLGTLDIQKILGDRSKQTMVTGMDMSEDGKKFLLITYSGAIEFNMDLSTVSRLKGNLVAGQDYSVARLKKLPQQEAIAYLPGSQSFVYTSEDREGRGSVPVLRVDCAN